MCVGAVHRCRCSVVACLGPVGRPPRRALLVDRVSSRVYVRSVHVRIVLDAQSVIVALRFSRRLCAQATDGQRGMYAKCVLCGRCRRSHLLLVVAAVKP